MKKIYSLLCLLITGVSAFTQSTNGELSLSELAVPTAPAFILLDAAPSNIGSPTTPKEFTLGMIQNFDTDSKWFSNYSMEFSPYWWFKPENKSVYSFAGLKKNKSTDTYQANTLGGIKFSSISLALLSKDMIPDSLTSEQKILSFGIRSNIIKKYNQGYATALTDLINQWHDAAQIELTEWQDKIVNETDPVKKDALRKKYVNAKPQATTKYAEQISDLINEKPLFSMDLAMASSTYGVGDTLWKAGRTAAWGNISIFIPMSEERPYTKYIAIEGLGRFMENNYTKSDSGQIVYSHIFDAGIKLGIELDRFTVAAEMIFRTSQKVASGDWQQKITGVLNYQLSDNLYATGTVGQDFGPENKILALFGINWGFGAEKTELPEN